MRQMREKIRIMIGSMRERKVRKLLDSHSRRPNRHEAAQEMGQ
jgi:hypothetical protein